MTLEGLSLNDGSTVKMSGDIFFDKSEDQFRLAITNVTSSVEANQVQANLSQASGALIIKPNGVAGIIDGLIDTELGDDMAAGSKVFVRINNTDGVVDEVMRLGEREVSVKFGTSETNVFDVTLDGFSLNIGNIVTLEGSFSFVSRDDFQVSVGCNSLYG